MAEMYEHSSQCDGDGESKPTQDSEALVLVVSTDHHYFRGASRGFSA
jgi:hypothetical protein